MTIGRIVGRLEPANTAYTFTATSSTGGGAQNVVIPTGEWYPSGDGTPASDLIEKIEDLVQALTNLTTQTWVLSLSTGLLTISNPSAATVTYTWTGTSTVIRDWLRIPYTGAEPTTTTVLTTGTSVTTTRCPKNCVYPQQHTLTDLPIEQAWVSQTESDAGNIETHYYGSGARRMQLGLRVQGPPRGTVGAYHDLRDWWRYARQGSPFRWYPDAAGVTGAYSEGTSPIPFGYETWILVGGDNFAPTPIQSDWYGYLDHTFVCAISS